jgi:hypothetical protein
MAKKIKRDQESAEVGRETAAESPAPRRRAARKAEVTASDSSSPAAVAEPPHQEPGMQPSAEAIAIRAYQLFLARGATDGHAFDDWLQAERELMALGQPT